MTYLTCEIFGEKSSWFWGMLNTLTFIISFIFIYKQIRIQNKANMISFIFNSDLKWKEEKYIEARKSVINKVGNSIDYNDELILSFFEDLGIFQKNKIVEIDLIWDKFSYYIENYWKYYESNVLEFRANSNDNTWYDNFERLYYDTLKLSRIKTNNKKYAISEEEFSKFIESESTL